MLFPLLLAAASLLGSLPAAVLSNAPRRRLPLAALLLAAGGSALFLGGLFLRARTANLTAVFDRFFPDRPAKLLGCGLLFGLCCLLGLLTGLLRAGGLGRYFRRAAGSRLHRAAALGALGGGLLLAAGWALLAWAPAPASIRLSELCCANFSLLADPDAGEYADYIELVNTGETPADLSGYYISDNPKKRDRFRLPALRLEPGQTVVLWADGTGKSGTRSGGAIHLSFSLRPGDMVLFSSPRGALLDEVTVPERYKNTSLSRLDGQWVLTQGTPALDNREGAVFTPPTLEAPTFSLAPGFYDGPQTLTLSAASGCEIRYTLDGSRPTAESPLYGGPLTLTDISDEPNRVVSRPDTTADRSGAITEPVDKGVVVRAAARDGSGAFSEAVTAVYFIGERFAKYDGLAVLNITADPEDLFGDAGILVTGPAYDAWLESGGAGEAPVENFQLRGRDWERDAELLLWDEDRVPLLDTACGLRVQGGSTRVYATKRFTFYARPVYGTDRLFSAPVFGNSLSHAFSTRPTAHEPMAEALAARRGLGGLDARRAAVFVNGEFYADTWLRERYDAQYFENHYGVAEKDLILIENDLPGLGTQEDYSEYTALMDRILAGDCSDPVFYAEVCRSIDPESYAAFMAVNLYLKNTDWSNLVNYKLWRTRTPKGEGVLDGRWRWLAFDMDSCFWTREAFGDAPRASYDIFSYPSVLTGHSFEETPLFQALLKSPEFRALFARTWLELLNVSFSYENSLPLLERFGLTEDAFWPEFLRDRPAYALDQLIRHILPEALPCALKLQTTVPGALLLDELPEPLAGDSWTGTWVTGVPLTLTAAPAEGWRFVGWTGSVESADQTLTLTPAGDVNLTAVYEPIAP